MLKTIVGSKKTRFSQQAGRHIFQHFFDWSAAILSMLSRCNQMYCAIQWAKWPIARSESQNFDKYIVPSNNLKTTQLLKSNNLNLMDMETKERWHLCNIITMCLLTLWESPHRCIFFDILKALLKQRVGKERHCAPTKFL